MTAGVFGRLPRVALIAAGACLLSATLTYAASSTLSTPAAPETAPVAAAEPAPLVVPDVRKQAYVFAKGSLEQEGFAWRVEGSVPGFAANTVVAQTPAPGTKVVADGAPIVVLRLARNAAYKQVGAPENTAPYPGKPARRVGAKPVSAKPAATTAKPVAAKPAATPKPAAPKAKTRTPAFVVAGAPQEPANEPLLSVRAKRLAVWLEQHPKPTDANVAHWLYQHNWIVTGARFGWAEGAAALRTLVAVDARVQELWGVGTRSEATARRALADVEARSR
jgi:hypothetical protein